MKRLLFSLLTLLITLSCDPEVKTPGEEMVGQISALAKKNKVTNAWVYEWSDQVGYVLYTNDASFSFDGNYIVITPDGGVPRYYNAEKLTSFEFYQESVSFFFK